MILGLKVGRRVLAAVALDDESFVFQHSRYAPSRTSTIQSGLTRYFSHLLEQVKPSAVYYYGSTAPQTLTEDIIKLLVTTAGSRGIPAKPLTKLDVFGSFGIQPFRTRQELRDHLAHLWPAIGESKPVRQAALAEAAATALVGEFRQELPDV